MVPPYTPTAPTLVRAPFHRDGWVYEEKVDGWRILAYKDGQRVRLVSRHGRDHTRHFVARRRVRAPLLGGGDCLAWQVWWRLQDVQYIEFAAKRLAELAPGCQHRLIEGYGPFRRMAGIGADGDPWTLRPGIGPHEQ